MQANILGSRIKHFLLGPTMHLKARRLILPVLLAEVTMVIGQTGPACAQASATSVQRQTTKPSSVPEEDRLRMRLQFDTHDAKAHKQLMKLLKDKYAFRAEVIEDATWLKNNLSDAFALIELISTSEVALQDPEFAIAQLRSYLAAVRREDDSENHDSFAAQLADKLRKRGRPEEALPLNADLVRLNPNDAGLWADYGDALSALGRYTEAVQALRHSIDLDPSMEVAHEALAETLVKSGDLGGAESEYRAALSIYKAQYKTGQPTDSFHSMIRAMNQYAASHHEENVLAEMHLKLARVLLLERNYDDGIAQTKAALDANKYEFVALYLRAEIYDSKGDHDQASKTRDMARSAIDKQTATEFSKLPKKDRPEADSRVLFLTDTLWNGELGYPALPSEIVSILEPRLADLSAFERVMLSTAYFAQRRGQEGKQQWEKAIATDSKMDTAASHANLGRELLKAGASSDALPHLRRAYELDPQNVTYRMDYETASQTLRH